MRRRQSKDMSVAMPSTDWCQVEKKKRKETTHHDRLWEVLWPSIVTVTGVCLAGRLDFEVQLCFGYVFKVVHRPLELFRCEICGHLPSFFQPQLLWFSYPDTYKYTGIHSYIYSSSTMYLQLFTLNNDLTPPLPQLTHCLLGVIGFWSSSRRLYTPIGNFPVTKNGWVCDSLFGVLHSHICMWCPFGSRALLHSIGLLAHGQLRVVLALQESENYCGCCQWTIVWSWWR